MPTTTSTVKTIASRDTEVATALTVLGNLLCHGFALGADEISCREATVSCPQPKQGFVAGMCDAYIPSAARWLAGATRR